MELSTKIDCSSNALGSLRLETLAAIPVLGVFFALACWVFLTGAAFALAGCAFGASTTCLMRTTFCLYWRTSSLRSQVVPFGANAEPLAGYPDMVYTANGGFVIDDERRGLNDTLADVFSLDYVALSRVGTASTVIQRRLGANGAGANAFSSATPVATSERISLLISVPLITRADINESC